MEATESLLNEEPGSLVFLDFDYTEVSKPSLSVCRRMVAPLS
jgi:hypothetical protein